MEREAKYRSYPTIEAIEKLARIEEFLNVNPGKYVPRSVAELARELSKKLRGQNEIDPRNFLKLAVEIAEEATAGKNQYIRVSSKTSTLANLTRFQRNTLLFAMVPQIAKVVFSSEFRDGVFGAIDEAIKKDQSWTRVSSEDVNDLSLNERLP